MPDRSITALLTLALLVLLPGVATADPPDEDVLRPNVPGSSPWFVQVAIGANITLMDGNPYLRAIRNDEGRTTMFDEALGVGPLIAVGAGYIFNDNFSLVLRADYDAKKVSESEATTDSCIIRDVVSGRFVTTPMQVNKSYDVGVRYLTLSLLPRYRFQDLYLFAGPSLGIPLSRTVSETDGIIGETQCTYFPGTADSTRQISGSLPDDRNMATRVAVKLGVGYHIPIAENVDVVPELGLDLALTNAFEQPDGGGFESLEMRRSGATTGEVRTYPINDQIRLHSLQATIGLRLQF